MSTELKQLIVVVEGTAALKPYWHSIFSDYLLKIIRTFCGKGLNRERNPACTVELSMVIFNSHGSHSACLVQRSGWTTDVDVFSHWLSSIQFLGGGFNDVATAEGLSEALMMFSPSSDSSQASNDFKRHCILITASTPYTFPKLQTVKQNESRLSNAETLASYFPWLSVTLSVLCPKLLPEIRAVYNAGKLNPKSVDSSTKNTSYLVLISENFVEAHAALSQSAANLPQTQSQSVPRSLPVGWPPNMPLSSNYVKVWEGNLYGTRQGQHVHIAKLVGYRNASASDSLAANWPPTMLISRLVHPDHIDFKQFKGYKDEFLQFRAITEYGFLRILEEKKLWAVIEVPSQTLLLYACYQGRKLMGMLFPKQQQQIQQQQQQQRQSSQLQLPQQEQLSRLQQQQQQDQSSPLNQTQLQTSPLNQAQQQTSPLNQAQQHTSPLNQAQTSPLNQTQQPQQMVESVVDGRTRERSQQGGGGGGGGGGEPNMPIGG